MYVICTYDVDERKCNKVMKLMRKYLFHVQRSVFEGTLTPKQFKSLKEEVNQIISSTDSVIYYYTYNDKQLYKEETGPIKKKNILIDD